MDIFSDDRVVLTLDAGGTNFVFNASRGGKALLEGICRDSHATNLDACLEGIREGFREVIKASGRKAVAISFAFPGPADYRRGIIDNDNNLPAFKGGVPLKDILEEEFQVPVFINNDGDLFTYGEALGGILPVVNARLEASGSTKRYHNLAGFTLGTGFGGGFVSNGRLIAGDNVTAAEVWLFSNRYYPEVNTEEVVSIRSVKRFYAREAGMENPEELEPRDIFDIARGKLEGNRQAAIKSYELMGQALGDAVANVLTFVDGIAVIGGGITGAREFYMPALMKELSSRFDPRNEASMPRLVQSVYNLDNRAQQEKFYRDRTKTLLVPGSGRSVSYDPVPRLAVATSTLGASESIALGAYAYALTQLK